MTFEQLGNLGEALGGIAVIVSLLALVYQIRQNTIAIRAQTARDSEAVWSQINISAASDPDRAALATRIGVDSQISDFNETERYRLHMWTRGIFQQIQSDYFLWKAGILQDDLFERRMRWWRSYVRTPVVKEVFELEVKQEQLDPKFIEMISDGPRLENLVLEGVHVAGKNS